MKIHDAWSRTDQGEPLFPEDVTAGVIYLLRNPLDLAASCANHWGLGLEAAVDRLCDVDYIAGGLTSGITDQLRFRISSWSEHVLSWIDQSGSRIHVLRYEDMLREPASSFEGVVRFLGLPLDPSRVARAVSFSSFTELQGQEQARGFAERLSSAFGPFFRRGQAGFWREELPRELVQRILRAQEPVMKRFGYVEG